MPATPRNIDMNSSGMGKIFQASFDGTCDGCGADIVAGDDVRYINHDLCCELCWDDNRRESAAYTDVRSDPCPHCHLIPSVAGVCGCDDA
jgi:hypothetical protein